MKMLTFTLMLCVLACSTGCSYGSMVAVGKNQDRVVILRNDVFLFGALRRAYVCKASDAGLVDCQEEESP